MTRCYRCGAAGAEHVLGCPDRVSSVPPPAIQYVREQLARAVAGTEREEKRPSDRVAWAALGVAIEAMFIVCNSVGVSWNTKRIHELSKRCLKRVVAVDFDGGGVVDCLGALMDELERTEL